MSKQMHNLAYRLAAPLSEFCPEFIQGMANRMSVSFHKYGFVENDGNTDRIANINIRLQRYLDTGNTEWLMDVANFAMIEFMHPRHPNAHFEGTDSDQSPGRQRLDGSVDADKNNNE